MRFFNEQSHFHSQNKKAQVKKNSKKNQRKKKKKKNDRFIADFIIQETDKEKKER